jgi:acyl-CoA thioesterase-2
MSPLSLDERRAMQAEFLEMVVTRPGGPDTAIGDTPDWYGPVLFGGFVVGQTLHAATTTVDPQSGRRPHSLHGYFMRPVVAGPPVTYRVERIRDGRSFTLRRVDAIQNGATVFTMVCSFTADTDGYEYELAVLEEVPGPDTLPEPDWPDGPWLTRLAGPSDPLPDGTRRSTHRQWMRLPDPLPDDAMLHATVAAVMSDMTGAGGRPLHLDGSIEGMISLDHAVWFHRPFRPDEWIYIDVHALVNTGGRGVLRATLHAADRTLLMSVAQEMLLRVVA